MNEEAAFLDTNILCYTKDSSDQNKHQLAVKLVEDLILSKRACISTQVINEFYVFLKRAARSEEELNLARITAQSLTNLFPVPLTAELQTAAWLIEQRFNLSWWDSLIIAAANQANCKVLYTEDMQHEQKIGELMIINPFY
jgi:predicted nucleic acid-binding protein